MRKTQTRSDTLYEVPGVVQKEGEKALCVCVCTCTCVYVPGVVVITLQTLQEVGKWEVCLGNRMQPDYLRQQKAMRLRGGRGDETGKGGYWCRG